MLSCPRLREISVLFLLVVAVILNCVGCGVKTASQDGNSSESLSLRIAGAFLNSTNNAVSPSTVTILNSGDSCTTDAQGNCEINTTGLSGNLEVEVAGAWGSNRFALLNIPTRAEEVTFEVMVNPSSKDASLMWQKVEEREDSIPSTVASLPANRCGLCHELHQFTRCALPSWKELHLGIYNCETEGEVSPVIVFDPLDPDLTEDPSIDLPVGSPTPKETPKKDPNAKYKTGLCVSCHSFRGTPKCSNSSWASLHSFYSCGGSDKKPDNKKPDKKKKKKKAVSANTSELVSFLKGLQ